MSRLQKTLHVVFFCGTVLGTMVAGRAQSPAPKDIHAARLKGIAHLKSQQMEDGSWEFTGHPVGITALCTIALIENGVPMSDPVVQKGYEYVVSNTQELTQTYDLALASVLLSKLDARTNRKTIHLLAGRLVAGQLTSGGWAYSCPKGAAPVSSGRGSRRRSVKLKPGGGDNSCTQFAVLGLWTASRSGAAIDKTMELVAKRFVATQNEDGGWPYAFVASEGEKQPSRSSMTFAGLFCLTVARAARLRYELQQPVRGGKTEQKTDEGTTLMSDPVYSKGIEQASKYLKGGGAARYYLWSVERLGVMLGLDHFGDTHWFNKGAAALLKAQGKDGAWKDTRGTLAETAFAILFLRKANLGSDITRMLQGDPEQPLQIITQKDRPRYNDLLAAVKASKPNDVIRVDSDGPLKMPHIECRHNLTIQAGFGYAPVFEYDRGDNAKGMPGSPTLDPETRYLAHISGGTLTLEGLKLEMEPPSYGTKVPWSAIRIEGGDLRMLNCTLTEGGRHGMAMIDIRSPTNSTIRNSLLVGGRAAVEIAAAGQQEVHLENCVLYSHTGVALVSPEKKGEPATISLQLGHDTFQTIDAFDLAEATTHVTIQSDGCAYETDWMLSSSFAPFNTTGRAYTGTNNVYDVSRWVRAKGDQLADINDTASWVTFWGEKEEVALKRKIGFQVSRGSGAYTHRVFGEDWSFSSEVRLPSSYSDTGIYGSLAGAGLGYSSFRDSIQYNEWGAATPQNTANH